MQRHQKSQDHGTFRAGARLLEARVRSDFDIINSTDNANIQSLGALTIHQALLSVLYVDQNI